jgi:hypothetical protein
MRTSHAVIASVLIAVSPALSATREDESAEAAREIVHLLDAGDLYAAAAEHPDAAGTFSAVIYVPGVQLLSITTTHPTVHRMRQILASGDYQRAYLELQTFGARAGRLFVRDLRANGLRPGRHDGEPFDVVWHDATRDIAYDGQWRRRRMSVAEYRDAFARDEERYAMLLRVVLAGMRQPSLTPAAPQHLRARSR